MKGVRAMKMLESGENYIETILVLQKRSGHVHSVDVANELGYSRASVSRAMGILRKKELITIDELGHIHFTPQGFELAEKIYERHHILTSFLEKTLKVSPETAQADACRIEHVISDETFEQMKAFLLEHGE